MKIPKDVIETIKESKERRLPVKLIGLNQRLKVKEEIKDFKVVHNSVFE